MIRHDAAKVSRLRTYLSWKDVRKNAKEQDGGATGANDAAELLGDDPASVVGSANNDKTGTGVGNGIAAGTAGSGRARRPKTAMPWDLSRMFTEPVPERALDDDELDDDDIFDIDDDGNDNSHTLARLREADERTREMTRDEYVHWSECRQASFTYRKSKRFREWCGMSYFTESRPNDDIIDVLGFLAFEGVVKLTREALEIKKQLERIRVTSKSRNPSPPPASMSSGNIQIDDNDSTGPAMQSQADGMRFLFSQPEKTQNPLEPHHILEAFRRLQHESGRSLLLRDFTGGVIKSHTTIF